MASIGKKILLSTICYIVFFVISYNFLDLNIAKMVHNYQDSIFVYIAGYTNILGRDFIYLIPIFLILFISYILKKLFAIEKILFIRKLCFYTLATIILTSISVLALKIVCARARPYMFFESISYYGFYGLRVHSDFWSFPSGHVATAASSLMPLSKVCKIFRFPVFIIIIICMLSRIFSQDHFLSDTIGSVYLVYCISICLYPKFYKK